MPEDSPLTHAVRGRSFVDRGLAESWDEPSRYGTPGLLARRAVRRAGRPIVSRQERAARELAHAVEGLALTTAAAGVPSVLDAATVVDVESAHGPLFMHRDDTVMTPQVQRTGRWEPAEERFLLAELRPGATFVDVGANIGYFTVVGANAVTETGLVVSVEAEPRNVAVLRANVWRRGLSNVAVLPMAAAAEVGYLRLALNEANRGDHQVHAAGAADDGLLIPAGRLDEVLRGMAVDVVKIDTQGADHDVVEGVRGLLRSGVTLLSEFWLEGLAARGVDPHAVVSRYEELGLHVELLTDDGVVPTTAVDAVSAAAGWEGQWVNLVLRVP
jgi:FkbM family methyltransferase